MSTASSIAGESKPALQLKKRAVLKGHTERIWCCAWSPDGTALATCGGDKTIRIWKKDPVQPTESKDGLEKWTCVQVLEGYHSRTIRCVAWSPTGTALASCSFDSTVAVWELQPNGEFACTASLEGHDHEAKWVCWSFSGMNLAVCGRDKSVWIWQSVGGGDWECLTVLTGHTQDVKQVKFHPSDEALFSTSYDNTLKVWTLEDEDWYNTCTLSDHQSTVWSTSFPLSATHLVTVGDDAKIILYRDRTHPQIVKVHGSAKVSQATLDAEGTAASKVAGSARAWKLMEIISAAHNRAIYCTDWSPAPAFSTKTEISPELSASLDPLSKSLGLVATCGADDAICILCPKVKSLPPEPQVEIDLSQPSETAAACVDSLEVVLRVPKAHESDVNCVHWNTKQFGVLASCGDDNVAIIWCLEPAK